MPFESRAFLIARVRVLFLLLGFRVLFLLLGFHVLFLPPARPPARIPPEPPNQPPYYISTTFLLHFYYSEQVSQFGSCP